MKNKILLLLTLFTLLTLTACKNKNHINLELEPVSKDDKITIMVKSNLPKDTKATLTLINKSNGYMAQDAFKIEDKKTYSNEFSQEGNPLEKGEYSLTLVIPVTEVQPESVTSILGENFKNIESEYLTELDNYKYLEKNITFIID